jgi:hypothetical protein
MSAGLPLENETELLAWVLLRAANRTQARDTTIGSSFHEPRRWPTTWALSRLPTSVS